MSDADFSAFASLIHDKTGIVINEAKRSMLVSRLSRRLRDLGLSDFQVLPGPARLPRRRRGARRVHFGHHHERHEFLSRTGTFRGACEHGARA
jgi:chemotaxis methyl-accepting protein methylase